MLATKTQLILSKQMCRTCQTKPKQIVEQGTPSLNHVTTHSEQGCNAYQTSETSVPGRRQLLVPGFVACDCCEVIARRLKTIRMLWTTRERCSCKQDLATTRFRKMISVNNFAMSCDASSDSSMRFARSRWQIQLLTQDRKANRVTSTPLWQTPKCLTRISNVGQTKLMEYNP